MYFEGKSWIPGLLDELLTFIESVRLIFFYSILKWWLVGCSKYTCEYACYGQYIFLKNFIYLEIDRHNFHLVDYLRLFNRLFRQWVTSVLLASDFKWCWRVVLLVTLPCLNWKVKAIFGQPQVLFFPFSGALSNWEDRCKVKPMPKILWKRKAIKWSQMLIGYARPRKTGLFGFNRSQVGPNLAPGLWPNDSF